MCGSCHDVVTPRGVELERTYQEWQTTFFAQPDPAAPPDLRRVPHAVVDRRDRRRARARRPSRATNGFHEHLWPAIDQALTAFPEPDAQADGHQARSRSRDRDRRPDAVRQQRPARRASASIRRACLTVRIDSIGTAHKWPSGAAQDRRAWLEVIAYDSGRQRRSCSHSGVVARRRSIPSSITDPNLFGLWDRTFKDDGTPGALLLGRRHRRQQRCCARRSRSTRTRRRSITRRRRCSTSTAVLATDRPYHRADPDPTAVATPCSMIWSARAISRRPSPASSGRSTSSAPRARGAWRPRAPAPR